MDISNTKIDISCPGCKRKRSVSLNDISNGKTVKCICGQMIKLVDKGHSMQRGIKDLNKAFSSLEKSFKKLGK